MNDLALNWEAEALAADLSIESNDLTQDEGLRTAVLLSLFLDRYADTTVPLPEWFDDRRGWWADPLADVSDDKIGSRLWLLARSKNTPDVVARAEEYAREALRWLVDDKVASLVNVTAEFLSTPHRGLVLTVQIIKPSGDPVSFRFGHTWNTEASRL